MSRQALVFGLIALLAAPAVVDAKDLDVKAEMAKAKTLLREKNYKGAIKVYGRVLKVEPKNISALYGRAKGWKNLKKYDRSVQDYTAAIELNRKYAGSYYNRALVYVAMDAHKLAEADLSRAIELSAKKKSSYFSRRATSRIAIGDMKGADADLTEVLALKAGDRAPNGTLIDAADGTETKLSRWWRKGPLLIEFGSIS